MKISKFIPYSLAGVALLSASSLSIAQGVTSVVVGPLGASASAPIPTLTDNLLIALGLLLAVVAVRVLRSQRSTQKFLSLVLLGSGLLIGAIGVDRSIAGVAGVVAMGDVCTQAGPIDYNPNAPISLQNGCTVDIEIRSFSSTECILDTESAACTVGQVLAPEGICNPLPQCEGEGETAN